MKTSYQLDVLSPPPPLGLAWTIESCRLESGTCVDSEAVLSSLHNFYDYACASPAVMLLGRFGIERHAY